MKAICLCAWSQMLEVRESLASITKLANHKYNTYEIRQFSSALSRAHQVFI